MQKGYAATSTRDIAEAAGIKQPSLYSHFRNKSDILLEVVLQGIDPAIARAEELAADPALTDTERLLTLVEFDARTLAGGGHDPGVFYISPGVDEEVVAAFRARFSYLREFYRRFTLGATPNATGLLSGEALVSVVTSVIEAVMFRRSYERDTAPSELAAQTRAAVERLIGAA